MKEYSPDFLVKSSFLKCHILFCFVGICFGRYYHEGSNWWISALSARQRSEFTAVQQTYNKRLARVFWSILLFANCDHFRVNIKVLIHWLKIAPCGYVRYLINFLNNIMPETSRYLDTCETQLVYAHFLWSPVSPCLKSVCRLYFKHSHKGRQTSGIAASSEGIGAPAEYTRVQSGDCSMPVSPYLQSGL